MNQRSSPHCLSAASRCPRATHCVSAFYQRHHEASPTVFHLFDCCIMGALLRANTPTQILSVGIGLGNVLNSSPLSLSNTSEPLSYQTVSVSQFNVFDYNSEDIYTSSAILSPVYSQVWTHFYLSSFGSIATVNINFLGGKCTNTYSFGCFTNVHSVCEVQDYYVTCITTCNAPLRLLRRQLLALLHLFLRTNAPIMCGCFSWLLDFLFCLRLTLCAFCASVSGGTLAIPLLIRPPSMWQIVHAKD